MKTHAGQLFVSFVAVALWATCGEGGPGVAVESSSGALAAGTVVTFEAEVLARTASAPPGSQVTSETGASGGQYVQLSGTPAAGAWIEFTLPNVESGTYDVKVLYKANFNRGIVQASIGGLNQGSPCDQYAATATQQKACALGSKTFTAPGNATMRFTVTGKNASSAGFMMVIDQISLTATGGSGTGGATGGGGATGRGGTTGTGGTGGAAGTGGATGSSVTVEAEVLTRAASATGSQVTSEAGASGGQYVQLSGTPAAGAWIEFTLPNVAAGTYAVKVLYKANFNRGIVQASIDGVNQGSPCDQYAATAMQQAACNLGNKTLTATGNRTMRFTVTGKNASSGGFMMVIDQISLTVSGGSGPGWVGTWSGAPQLTESTNLPPASLSNSTLRQVIHVSVGGSQLRVRFSNEFGNGPVTINAAHVARATRTRSTAPSTRRPTGRSPSREARPSRSLRARPSGPTRSRSPWRR